MALYRSKRSLLGLIEGDVAKGGSCPILGGLKVEIPPRYSTSPFSNHNLPPPPRPASHPKGVKSGFPEPKIRDYPIKVYFALY